jgi:hypothetical protein
MKKVLLVLTAVLITALGCAPGAAPSPTEVAPTATSTFVQPTPSYSVEVTKDIEYVKLLVPDAPVQTLDVYAPTEPGPWPVVVLHHGGYQQKDITMYASFAEELAGRGVVVFVPQRRSESQTLEEYIRDDGREVREVQESWACGIRFARESAADYGGDAGHITVLGHESTGLDVSFVGDDLQREWEEVAASRGGPPPQTECLASGDSAHVDAFVGYGGDFDFYERLSETDPDLYALTSPIGLIGRNPSLVIRLADGGMGNPTIIERAVKYQEDLVNAGYDATQTLLGEARWQLPYSGPEREELIQMILEVARA